MYIYICICTYIYIDIYEVAAQCRPNEEGLEAALWREADARASEVRRSFRSVPYCSGLASAA